MKYDKYAVKARTKLTQYGSKVHITRVTEGAYNKETNEYSDTTQDIWGVGLQDNLDLSKIDGKNILAGDLMLMCVLDGEPKVDDSLEWGGASYNVVNVYPMSPDGSTVIYYTLQLRR